MINSKFTLIKKIAKHGKQSIIVIPKLLQDKLKPEKLTQITIEIIKS
jgi:hypothetical protein